MGKLNISEVLKLAGFVTIVGGAYFASGPGKVFIFVGAVAVAVGYLYTRLKG